MKFFSALQPYLILCSMGYLSHWLESGNFHDSGKWYLKVWVNQRVWCDTFGITCINVEFGACFGKNSTSLSYDVKLKWCCLITLYHGIEDYSQNLYLFLFSEKSSHLLKNRNHLVNELRVTKGIRFLQDMILDCCCL